MGFFTQSHFPRVNSTIGDDNPDPSVQCRLPPPFFFPGVGSGRFLSGIWEWGLATSGDSQPVDPSLLFGATK